MIACLLPVRDGASELPAWLECAGRVADLVIALDDGSTDATAEILEASPLVETVLRNPPRASYAGWDDAANRQRLLDAAVEAGVDWALFLDADERIDADDAEALRGFVRGDALAGCAYGLQVFRTWGDRVAPSADTRLPPVRARGRPAACRRSAFTSTRCPPRSRGRLGYLPPFASATLTRPSACGPAGAATPRPTRKGRSSASPCAALEGVPDDLVEWRPRPAGLPVILPAGELGAASPAAAAAERRPRLACLLPVHNGAEDLPGYLE